MTKRITLEYGALLKAADLNERFGDMFSTSILNGFRLHKGTSQFTLSVKRDNSKPSVLLTTDGIRIEDTADSIDVLSVTPNTNPLDRYDVVYMIYLNEMDQKTFYYVIVPGVPGQPPDYVTGQIMTVPIGHVRVRQNLALSESDVTSLPLGINVGKEGYASTYRFKNLQFVRQSTAPSLVEDNDGKMFLLNNASTSNLDELRIIVKNNAGAYVYKRLTLTDP